MKIEIELRRHGKWDYKNDKLTKEGREETKKVAEDIGNFDLILSQATGRGFQTAVILSDCKGKIESYAILNELPGIKCGENFVPEIALERAKKVLGWILENIFTSGILSQNSSPRILVITSGGVIGAIKRYLSREKIITREDVCIFRPLEGLRIKIEIEEIKKDL